MLGRAFSLAQNCAVGIVRRGDGVAHHLRLAIPSTAASIPTSNHGMAHHGHRSICSSPPLLESSSDVMKGPDSDEKKAIIKRWMNWNQSKVWRYEPNHDLIAKIGKEGSTSLLDEFRDLVPNEKREAETVGRSWSARELRRKSYDDLHKLWYVLYKEKNMLMTESNLARRHGYEMVQPERRRKVKKSMGAIKQVMGERKRGKIADHKAYLEELKRYDGLMKEMKVKSDPLEDAMHSEAEKLSSSEKM